MNSYQTVNAAFAAAGLTKQAAVNFGRRYEAGLWDPFGNRTLFEMLVEVANRRELIPVAVRPGTGKTMFGNAPRVDHDPVGRWNAEDKERQLRLKGAGGVTASRAGGTSMLRWVVRASDVAGRWDVVDLRLSNKAQATFGSWHWANIARQAWEQDMSVTNYGRAKGIDVSGFTLA